jgi:hypothetical protein
MDMRLTHTVGEEVGEMAGAIVLISTSTIPGRDIPATAAIIRSFTTLAVRLGMRAAASTAAVEAFMVEVVEDTVAVAAVIVE